MQALLGVGVRSRKAYKMLPFIRYSKDNGRREFRALEIEGSVDRKKCQPKSTETVQVVGWPELEDRAMI